MNDKEPEDMWYPYRVYLTVSGTLLCFALPVMALGTSIVV